MKTEDGVDDVEGESEAEWRKFSDSELLSRLLRRQVEPVAAKGLVRDREIDSAIEEINEVLGQEYLDEYDQPIRFEIPLDRRRRR